MLTVRNGGLSSSGSIRGGDGIRCQPLVAARESLSTGSHRRASLSIDQFWVLCDGGTQRDDF